MKKQYTSVLFIAITVLILFIFGCSGDDSGGVVTGPAEPVINKVSLNGVIGTVSVEGGNNGAEAGADVFVMGQEGSKTVTDSGGQYALDVNVQISGMVSSKAERTASATPVGNQYYLVVYSNDKNYGTVLPFTLAEDEVKTINPMINGVGSISGQFTLQGQSDHTGISVYLPGTAYSATTASDGSFYMAGVPSGWYPYLRAEKDGYHYVVISGVLVLKESDTPLLPQELLLSTGALGTVTINGGAEFTNTPGASLTFSASSDAVLMMVSESSSYIGAQWVMYNTPMPWTFSAGSGMREIYAKFADANGLESGTYMDTIYVDTDPRAAAEYPVAGAYINNSAPLLQWRYDPPMPGPAYLVEVSGDPAFDPANVIEGSSWQGGTSYQLLAPLTDQGTYYWRVRMSDAEANVYAWSGPWAFTVDLGGVELITPMGTISDTLPTLKWTASTVPGASYEVEVTDDASFTLTPLEAAVVTGGTRQYTMTTQLSNDKTYYWRVRVVDGNGTPGQWNEGGAFHVYLGLVSLIRPMGYITNTSPLLDWTASSLPASTYRVEVDEDPAFGSVLEWVDGISLTSHGLSNVLSNNGTYYWRVRINDQYGEPGTWAGPQSFTISLGTVPLLSPQGVISNTTPTLQWGDSPLANATYRMQLATDSAFTAIQNDQGGIAMPLFDLAAPLKNLVNYFWRVAVEDERGVQGDWSGTGLFAVDLGTVTPIGPTGTITDTRPTLTWTASALPGVSYEVQLALDDAFTIFVPGMMNAPAATAALTTTTLDNNQVYFWRVRVRDASGVYGKWSYSQSFKVGLPAVDLLSPDGTIADTVPTFSWTGSTAAMDYHIMVSEDNTFGTWLINATTGGATSHSDVGVTFELNKTYYWKVALIDANGVEGGWSYTLAFKVDLMSVKLLSPDGAITNTAPVFSWAESPLAASYHILVSDDSNFGTWIINDTTVTGTTYQNMGQTFALDTTYYWKVAVIDSNTVEGDWSAVKAFVVSFDDIFIISPTGGTSDTLPLIEWTPSAMAGMTYDVEISNSLAFGALDIVDSSYGQSGATYQMQTVLDNQTIYYWRVRGVDDHGVADTTWTGPQSFTVDLGTVTPIGPTGTITDTRPTVTWTASALPGVSYEVQLALDDAFTSFVPGMMNVSAGANTDIQTPVLNNNQSYYWRVRVKDASGVYGNWTGPQSFKVSLGTVTQISPSGTITDTRPTLSWYDSPLIGETYHVQFAADPGFGTVIEDVNSISGTSYPLTGTLSNLGNYYWRVALKDANNVESAWSSTMAFKVDLGTVILSAPTDKTVTSDATPLLSWQANPVAVSYFLKYSQSPDLAGAVVVSTSNTWSTPTLSATDYTEYFWAVIPRDANNVQGAMSAVRSFVLDTSPPAGGIVIEGGDLYAFSSTVDVALTAQDPGRVAAYFISEDPTPPVAATPGWVAISPISSYSATISFALSSGSGQKVVNLWFMDTAGNISSAVQDDITLQDYTSAVPHDLSSSGYRGDMAIGPDGVVHLAFYDYSNTDLVYQNNGQGTWSTAYIVDFNATSNVSVAVDPDGYPHIYYFNSSGTLMHATNATGSWVKVSAGLVALKNALDVAIDPDGVTHLVYRFDTSNVRYANDSTGSWVTENMGSSGSSPSIALDSNNKAHVTYRNWSTKEAMYTTNSTGSWVPVTVGSNGDYPSVALDTNNIPHICYYDSVITGLKYARWTGSFFDTTIVDSKDDVGYACSLDIDSFGSIHMGYVDDTNKNLKYATNRYGDWRIEVMDSSWVSTYFSNLAVDALDNLHFAYSSSAEVRYLSNSGQWRGGIIHSDGVSGSIDLDSLGNVHVAFVNAARDIMYADNTSGAWKVDMVNSGSWVAPSLAVDSADAVHISFSSYPGGANIQYATGSFGSWAERTISGAGTNVKDTSIDTDSGGGAHITYTDYINVSTHAGKYITNTSGSWSTPLTLDTGGYTGAGSTIDVDETTDSAYVTFIDQGTKRIMHTDNAGGSWRTAYTDANSRGAYYDDASMVYVGGATNKLHVSYYNYYDDYLMYAESTPGSTSSTTVWVDGGINDVGRYSSLAIDSAGFAHISYYDATEQQLKYATNKSGDWMTYVVDQSAQVGEATDIAITSDGFIYIVYNDVARGLKFAVSKQ